MPAHPFFKPEILLLENRSAPVNLLNSALLGLVSPGLPGEASDLSSPAALAGALPTFSSPLLLRSETYSYLPQAENAPHSVVAPVSSTILPSAPLVANLASAGSAPDLMLLSQLDVHPFDNPHFPSKQTPLDPGSLPSSEASTISAQSAGDSGSGAAASGDGSALVGSDPPSSRSPDYTPDALAPSAPVSSSSAPVTQPATTSGIGSNAVGASGTTGSATNSTSPTTREAARHAPTLERLAAQPMAFEENRGQTDAEVRYLARGQNYTLFLTGGQAVLSLARPRSADGQAGANASFAAGHVMDTLALTFDGANPGARVVPVQELPQRTNYFRGDVALTNLANFGRVRVENLYDGVSVEYYGTQQGKLEYDFIVAPGHDLSQVRMSVQGATANSVDANGNLKLTMPGGVVTQSTPVLYQDSAAGARTPVQGSFLAHADGSVGFQAANFDPAFPLVIDPILDYSTYLGGNDTDVGLAIAVDGTGNSYITGSTASTDFPTLHPFQGSRVGVAGDAFITKFKADGTGLVYSTYLGGLDYPTPDEGRGVAIDAAGNAYVTGVTTSPDFPVTAGAFQTSLVSICSSFVTKLNATGDALLYSSYLHTASTSTPGSLPTFAHAIAVDKQGFAYVVGETSDTNFPTTSGAFQPTGGTLGDAFIAKFNQDGTALDYASYYGNGLDIERAYGVAVDDKGVAYVTGSREPATSGGLGGPGGPGGPGGTGGGGGSFGSPDVFVFRVNAAGSGLLYDISLGGSGSDIGNAIALDRAGNAYVAGFASSGFPTTTGACQTTHAGNIDAFVAKLDGSGATVYSTFLGGAANDVANGIAVTSDGRATLVGTTSSTGWPTANALPGSGFGHADMVVAAQLNAAGTGLVYSTFVGEGSGNAVAIDLKNSVYLTGGTADAAFPTTSGAYQTSVNGTDAFLVKLRDGILPPVLTSITTDTGYSAADFVTYDQTLVFDGTAPALSTVHLFLLGAEIGTATADAVGDWSFDYTATTLPEDTYAITLQAELSSVFSEMSVPYRFIVDTTPPEVTVAVPATTTSFSPLVEVWAHDDIALPPNATATIDVDFNNDNDFLDSGEQNVASASIVGGYVQIAVPLGALGNYHVQARVTDLAGNEGTSASVPVEVVTTPSPWDFDAYVRVVEHTDGLPLEQLGGPRVLHPLDLDDSPGSGNSGAPALVYNASLVHVRPIVQALVQLPGSGTLPSTFTATLTWNGGAPQTPVTFSTAGLALGDKVTIAVQVASPVATTGRYEYQLALTVPGYGSPFVTNESTFVRVEDASAFGPGWTLSTLNRLVDIPASGALPAGQLWLYGDGTFRFFEGTTGSLTSPAEDHGTLAVTGGGFEYTTPDDSKIVFDSSGLQTSWTAYDAIQNIQFSYSSGNLDQMVAIDGSTTTFNGGATITSIDAPGGRTWTIGATSITDPDSRVDAFTYNGDDKMLTRTFGAVGSVWTYHAGSGLVDRATWGTSGSPSYSDFLPAVGRGLVTPFVGEPYALATDALAAVTRSMVDRQGHLMQRVNALGATEKWTRYADGLVYAYSDPLQRVTSYTRDADGYVTLETLPDTNTRAYAYGIFHQLASFTNERNKTTTYTLASGTGHVLSVTDAEGDVTSYTYLSGSYLVSTITDPMTRVTTLTYDGSNRVATSTTVLGTTTTTYDSVSGEVASVEDPLTRVVSYTHDANGRMLTMTDAMTKVSTWVYNSSGLLELFTNANGGKTKTYYDGAGRGLTESVVEAADSPVSRTTLNSFDAMGRVDGRRDALGYWTLFEMDQVGAVIKTTDPMQGVLSYRFDLAGQLTKTSDQLGYSNRYQYNDRGWPTIVTDARGKNWTTEYNEVGSVTGTIDPLGKHPLIGYDDVDRVVSTNDGAGNTTGTTYWPDSTVETTTDGRGIVTEYETDYTAKTTTVIQALGTANQRVVVSAFNEVGEVQNVKDGPTAGAATHLLASYSHNDNGWVTRAEDALGHGVDYDYDFVGNVTKTTDALGKFTQITFDALNRPFKTIDRNNIASTTLRDAMDQVVASIDGANAPTVAVYDELGDNTFLIQPSGGGIVEKRFNAVGWQTALIDPVGNATKWSHNAVGQVTLQTDPRGETKSFTYLDNGWLDVATDERGKTETYTYLDNGWVDNVVVALGMATNTKTFGYNGNGQVESASDTNGGLDWTYDELGRLETFDDTTGNTLTYAYDSDFRLDNVSDTLGGVRSYDYDGGDRVTGVAFNDGAAELSVGYTYNNRDEVTEVRRYSDDAYTSQVGKTNLVHDDGGRTASITHKDYTNATLNAFTYTYDNADRVASEASTLGPSRTYTHDGTGQVTGDGSNTYNWDAVGNDTANTTTARNQLDSDGTWNYFYDDSGNTTSKVNISSGEVWQYGYDLDNRLVKAEHKASSGGAVDLRTEYKYDVVGNLIERSVDLDGAGAGTPVVTKHAYDENGNACADLTAGGSLTTRRLYADAVDALMARIGSSNDEDWYLTDLLGSVRDIADSTGAGINHLDYDTFGGVATETSPTDGDRYAWTGRERDVETGLQYNRARWYDPATKRWLSQDPMGFDAGDSNLYRYATNSAASSTDPSGLDEIPSNMRASKAQLGGDCRMANGGNISKSPFDLSALAQSGKKAKVYPNQIIWTGDYDNLLAAQKSQQASPPLYRDLVPNDMQAKATEAWIAHNRSLAVEVRLMTELASLAPIPYFQSAILYLNQFLDQIDPDAVSQIPRMMADTRGLPSAAARGSSVRYQVPTPEEIARIRDSARLGVQMPQPSLIEQISGVTRSVTAPASTTPRTGPVSQLEVGPYGPLARRSVGDGLTPDHIPSFAAVRANVERQLGRRLTDAEASALRDQTNTIVIRTQTHQQGSRTYGGRNTAQQIQTDSQNLQAAFQADRAALRQRLIQDGHTPEAVDAAFQRLDELNRQAGRY